MKKLISMIIITTIITAIINCNPITNENNQKENYGEVEIQTNEININIKINNPEIKVKLYMIPPDSGFWIHGNDTININSISEYIKNHVCEDKCSK